MPPKALLHGVAVLIAAAACAFTVIHSSKFSELQKDRLATNEQDKVTAGSVALKQKQLREEEAAVAASGLKKDELDQSISMLRSQGAGLGRELADLENTLADQKEEMAVLEKATAEVAEILSALGGDVSIDSLPNKIAQIEEMKLVREKEIEQLDTNIAETRAIMGKNREELDGLVKRKVDRDARISRNGMESVITAVNQDWGFLLIGAGANSGFSPQNGLIVKRDGRYIGRVRPSSVEPTQTIAEIDAKSMPTGVRLQPGDRVILSSPTTN
jgi:uncharacterized coiled-coil protein SlyX